ncbi:MAG: YbjN domain-containing protein [Actinomycetia bacterium]|nr:YbjN domain-containing protein [Actinomycetes bacterium]
MSNDQSQARAALSQYLASEDLEFEEPTANSFVLQLPGEQKLRTTVSLVLGAHSMTVNAFVARHPDENHEEVFRWLLKRNRRLFGVAYALDHLNDVYLVGRLPLDSVNSANLDRLLGSVLSTADGDFNTILEIGFASSIRAEWEWRLERGEPTDNLAAFDSLRPEPTNPE